MSFTITQEDLDRAAKKYGRPRLHASERPATLPSRLMTTKKGKKGYSRKNKHKFD